MKLYDSNVVLLNPEQLYLVRAEINDDSGVMNGKLEISVGSAKVYIHMNKGKVKAFRRKIKLILTALDKLISWKEVPGVKHYRTWLNPPSSAMGGTVYVFCENIADEKSEMYGFFEIADCTRKLRIFLDRKDDFKNIAGLRQVVSDYVEFLETL